MSIINCHPNYHGHRQIPPQYLSTYAAKDDVIYDRMLKLTLSHNTSLIQKNKRLIDADSLSICSYCSVINPGALYLDNQFQLLCRGEPDEAVWFGDFLACQPIPLWCQFDAELNFKTSFSLSYREFPPQSRPEDWRLFEYQGKLYTNHSIYMLLDWERWILRSRPGISEIDLDNRELKLCSILEPPFEASHEEKNWSFFVHNGNLLCIYSFRPYIILEVDLKNGTTKKLLECNPFYRWYEKGRFIGNSTNLVSWDTEHYIMFVHDFLEPRSGQRNRAYMQYGILISKESLLPTSIIPCPLIIGGDELGRHPGVHYTSALVNQNMALYAFYGEGDTHTGVTVLNKHELSVLFEKHRIKENQNSNYTHVENVKLMKGIDPRKGIIVSFPRSGLNWVRYCIEHFTGLRTAGRTKLIQDGELAVYRTHDVNYRGEPDSCECSFYDEEEQPLHKKVVLLLRDYRESFIRITKAMEIHIPSEDEIEAGHVFHFRNYFENLRAYDQFHGKKLLIWYPDLIGDFSTVLKILDFLDLSYDLENFDLEYHRQKSLELYDQQHKSYTKENLYDFSYHKNGVNANIVEALDAFVNRHYQDLVARYLR